MLHRDDRGTAYVEHLLVFPPLFMMLLGSIQLGLLFAAHMGVQHAAVVATRAAVVIIPDHPEYYDGTDASAFAPGSGCGGSGPRSSVTGFGGSLGGGSSGRGSGGDCKRGPRVAAIRSAAILAMIPYSLSAATLLGDRFADVGGQLGQVGAAGVYNMAAVGVTFPTAPKADTHHPASKDWGDGEKVTVRVSYLAQCGIPLVNRLVCHDIITQPVFGSASDKAALKELGAGGAKPRMLGVLGVVSGQRFVVLRAEATLPNQGASYKYDTTRFK